MSRVIKFRAWHTGINKMFSANEMGDDQLTIMPDGRGFINVHGDHTHLSQFMTQMVAMQFTGLLDKNGKDIYEGDIIRYGLYETETESAIEYTGVVEFITGQFECGTAPLYAIVDWGADVIGNVHENPSML